MKKIILILIVCLFPLTANAIELPNLYSENVIVYDRTDNKVLYERNASKQIRIASLTKIMTTITAIENIDNLDEEIIITDKVFEGIPWDASVAKLKVGDKVTYRDLLYASILPSGADATQALAINISGSVDTFIEKMNALAKEIGMNNSNFVNVTGLDKDNHYSTLNDVLTLLNYSLNNETFKMVYNAKEYELTNGLKVESTINIYNRNLNLDTARIIGSKTGYTSKSGLCISVLFESDNHEFITITTSAPYIYGEAYNLKDALKIIDFIDTNYNNQILINKDDPIKTIPVSLSKISKYEIVAKEDIALFLPNDYDKKLIKIIYEGKEELSFNNHIDDEIGIIKYYYKDKLLKEENVVLNVKIDISLEKVLIEYKEAIIVVILFTIIIVLSLIFRKKKVL